MVVVDEQAFRELPASIAIHRAGLARLLGDVAGTMAHARRALELVGEDDLSARGGAAALLGLASWTDGDLEAAHRSYADAMREPGEGRLPVRRARLRHHAWPTSGWRRVGWARRCASYERGLQVCDRARRPVLRGAADMHVGLERDPPRAGRPRGGRRAPGAEPGARRGERPARRTRTARGSPRRVIRQAEGDLDGALELLDEAERRYDGDFSPDVRPVAAVRARVLDRARAARRGAALGARRGLSTTDDLDVPARVRAHHPGPAAAGRGVARSGRRAAIREAVALLARLLAAAEDRRADRQRHRHPRRPGARPQPAATRRPPSRRWRGRSTLAEPEGYVRIFVDEGPPMAALLKLAARQPTPRPTCADCWPPSRRAGRDGPSDQPLIEPLSERELEVLRLLESDLDGPDIARELIGLAAHRADPHAEHLREARREQPAGRGPPCRRARPALAHATDPRRRRLARPGRGAGRLASARRPREIITSLITCGDARSSHPPPRCAQ